MNEWVLITTCKKLVWSTICMYISVYIIFLCMSIYTIYIDLYIIYKYTVHILFICIIYKYTVYIVIYVSMYIRCNLYTLYTWCIYILRIYTHIYIVWSLFRHKLVVRFSGNLLCDNCPTHDGVLPPTCDSYPQRLIVTVVLNTANVTSVLNTEAWQMPLSSDRDNWH